MAVKPITLTAQACDLFMSKSRRTIIILRKRFAYASTDRGLEWHKETVTKARALIHKLHLRSAETWGLLK